MGREIDGLIRRITPKTIAQEITNVQPMSESSGEFLTIKHCTENTHVGKFGDVIHDFIRGWMIYDGSDFVNFIEFIDKYGTKNISESMKEKLSQWYYNEKTMT